MNQRVLKCDLHDYLEIACMYRISVEIETVDDQSLIGIPQTTKVGAERVEQLVFLATTNESNSSDELLDIPVLSIATMTALTENPHFDKISFVDH